MSILTEQDDTLAMLRDSLARYLDNHHGFEQRLHALRHGRSTMRRRRSGRACARELDLLGAALPEAQGGLGGGMPAHLALMETLGGALAAEPYLSTMVIGAGLLQRHPGAQADALLARVVAGQAVLAFAHSEPQSRHDRADVQAASCVKATASADGRKAVVQAAPWASHLVVRAAQRRDAACRCSWCPKTRPACACAPTRRATVAAPPTSFSTTRACRRRPAGRGRHGAAADRAGPRRGHARHLRRVHRRHAPPDARHARLRAPAQAVRRADLQLPGAAAPPGRHAHGAGAGRRAHRERGRGHRCRRPHERARAVSSAKVAVAKACRAVGQGAVQLHGGMGMTEELAVGHYVRRATLIEGQFGSAAWHLRRVARLRAGRTTARRSRASASTATASAHRIRRFGRCSAPSPRQDDRSTTGDRPWQVHCRDCG
jgi:alkylation response protein AidB-like acyl-CoA dehydrogenase